MQQQPGKFPPMRLIEVDYNT